MGKIARLFVTLCLALVSVFVLFAQSSNPKPKSTFALSRATAFSIDSYEGYKLVTVKNPWPGAKEGFSYLLYKRGTKKPADSLFPKARRIETPVRKVVSFSTSYIPSLVSIGESASIVGVDSAAYIYDAGVRAAAASGKIAEVAKSGVPDIEQLIALAPDAVFTYGMGSEWDSHPKLIEAGLPVVIDGEWNESDPLARAEWSVYLAAFYDKESQAEAAYKATEAAYNSLKAKVAKASGIKPKVVVNGPFQGNWYVSAGGSFMARLIGDAGGSYLWADTAGTGGVSLTVEAAYATVLSADVWLNPGFGMSRLADLASLDTRFIDLPVVKSGQVWNNDKRSSPTGGNDYFESAVIHPDEVLADLVSIFRPDILAGRNPTWFQRLGK